jgi:small subunit ribosomal protein S18
MLLDALPRDHSRYELRSRALQLCELVCDFQLSANTKSNSNIDDPSRTTAADGLLASLDEHGPSQSLYSSRPARAGPLPQPVRLTARNDSHTAPSSSNQRVSNLIAESRARSERQKQSLLAGRKPGQPSLTTVQELENAKRASDLSKQIWRRWRAGDVYAPHDLSAAEAAKWKKRDGPKHDIFDVLDFKPLENYKVRRFLSFYFPISKPNFDSALQYGSYCAER